MGDLERKEFCAKRAQELAEKLKQSGNNKILVRLFFIYLIASI